MFRPAPRLVAVLGPTNTGKTHLAIERMLGHRSGMIGFPLRLLARENYDRIVKLRGARSVALITGEEKILPPNPSYFVCTVESMPLDALDSGGHRAAEIAVGPASASAPISPLSMSISSARKVTRTRSTCRPRCIRRPR